MQHIKINVDMVASRPVGGVLSARYGRGDHPSKRPTRGLPCRAGRAARVLCLALLQVGFTQPARSP